MTARLQCVEINPPTQPRSSVIWLHGLGADGHDFEGIVPELDLPASLSVRFVFPHAPIRPVTINGGHPMRAWCDIETLDFSRYSDLSRLAEALGHVNTLVRHEIASGIPARSIVLAGFSQGGAVALLAGLSYPQPLAGILALSTYFPAYQDQSWVPSTANHHTPIFFGHGIRDRVVLPHFGTQSRDALLAKGCTVEWRDYPMDHSVCAEEVADISSFLTRVLSANGAAT